MDSAALFYTVQLLLHDVAFVQDYGARFPRELFPKGPLQALAVLGREQAGDYRQATSKSVLDIALAGGWDPGRYGTTPEEMGRVYLDLRSAFPIDSDGRARVVELALEWGRQRHLAMAISASAQALSKGDEAAARTALSAAQQPYAVDTPPLRLNRDFRQALGPLPDNAVPTGFSKMDGLWKGGIRPGELGVALAGTNVGKTQTLCYFAAVAYKTNHRVLYYTFELNPSEVLRRIASGVLRRSVVSIPVEQGPELLEAVRTNRGITDADIEIRSGTKTVADLILDLQELDQDGQRPALILLDSADDLIPRESYQTLYMTQGEIYSDLRKMAIAQRIPIWTSTQATRESIDKARISLKHMGDSFWKARRAHYVLGFSQTEGDRNDPFGPYMTMYILKDSEHSTTGWAYSLRPKFGKGTEEFPGFEEVERDELAK